ncbi:MAG: response regulator, partial [Candidatus Altiarchaeota archaeon]|nr:response regulator [Candidatus Altiarchaeota archaeon]
NKKLGGIQTIVLTNSEDHTSIKKAYELGANAYITKPIDPIDLIKKIIELDDIKIEVCPI